MTDPRIQAFSQEAKHILNHLQGEFGKLQTGRANASLVEHIDVEAYGSRQPLKTIAGVLVQDARTLVIQPWDPGILADEPVGRAAAAPTVSFNEGYAPDGHVVGQIEPRQRLFL